MQTVNVASRNANPLELHSVVGFAHEGAEVRITSRNYPQLELAEDASPAELSSAAQIAEVIFTSRSKRAALRPSKLRGLLDLSAENGRCGKVLACFSLGARFRFLNVVDFPTKGGRLLGEVVNRTDQNAVRTESVCRRVTKLPP